jgi:CRISPR system Cascade subunit CasE
VSLTLLQCHPDPRRLAAWATRFGLTAGGDDLGYALHTLLAAAFGEAAPKPFRHLDDARGLLAYSAHDADRLQLAAQMAAPDVHAVRVGDGPAVGFRGAGASGAADARGART